MGFLKNIFKKDTNITDNINEDSTKSRIEELEENVNNNIILQNNSKTDYKDLDIFARVIMTQPEYSQYENAKRDFSVHYIGACNKYIPNKEVTSIFSTFFYDYLIEHVNSFLYEYGAPKYVENIKRLVENTQIKLDIDWDNYNNKEPKYQEALIDILTTEINQSLAEKGKILFGINIGDPSALFFITDINNYNVLALRNSNFYSLYDIDYYSQFYGEIFKLNEDISDKLKRLDYIEKKGDKYTTLFNGEILKYTDNDIQESKLTKIL